MGVLWNDRGDVGSRAAQVVRKGKAGAQGENILALEWVRSSQVRRVPFSESKNGIHFHRGNWGAGRQRILRSGNAAAAAAAARKVHVRPSRPSPGIVSEADEIGWWFWPASGCDPSPRVRPFLGVPERVRVAIDS